MADTHARAVFNPHPTLGALEIGVIVSSILFGVMSIQTYFYFNSFPKDSRWTKRLVAFIWFCEFGQTICIVHTLYVATISFYGHPERLLKAPVSLDTAILFSGFIGPLVQTFFAHRVYQLSKSYILPMICVLLSFLRFVGSIAAFVQALRMTSLAQYSRDSKWLLTAILSVGAAVDLLIAGALVVNLARQRTAAYKSTVTVIDRLIAWTIETGLLTSISGLTMLTCFLTMQDNYVWLAFFMFLARLFSNSLLASLNGRITLRNLTEDVIEFSRTGNNSSHLTAVGMGNTSDRLKKIRIGMTKSTDTDDPDISFRAGTKNSEMTVGSI